MHPTTTLLTLLLLLPHLLSAQTCNRYCGKQLLKYPFGTSPGCGDPRFQKSISCNQNHLSLSTHTGCYPITAIDYTNQIIHITDPTMSTCSCHQPSKGFSLDGDAPFTFHERTLFALLDCDTTSSSNGLNSSTTPLCDRSGAPVCSLLFSCQPVSNRFDAPLLSSCCVYAPVDLGPSYEMDLQKLRCGSYSAIYGFDGRNSDPATWDYGIALKYKFNFNNEYPAMCGSCEKSNGVCGYTGDYQTFVCNCPTGLNTTTDCFYGVPWSRGSQLTPWQIGTWLVNYLVMITYWGLR